MNQIKLNLLVEVALGFRCPPGHSAGPIRINVGLSRVKVQVNDATQFYLNDNFLA